MICDCCQSFSVNVITTKLLVYFKLSQNCVYRCATFKISIFLVVCLPGEVCYGFAYSCNIARREKETDAK